MSENGPPIALMLEPESLRRNFKAASKATPEVALSLPMGDARNTRLTVSLDYYMVGSNRAAARRFLAELESFRYERTPREKRFARFEALYKEKWSARTQDEWGLMLIMWYDQHGMRDPRDDVDPDTTFANQVGDWAKEKVAASSLPVALSANLAQWLRIPLSYWKPFEDFSWFAMRIGSRVTIKLDTRWIAAMEYDREVRLTTLSAAVEIGGPACVRMALVILSVIPVGRGVQLIAFTFQSIVGLLDFLFTMWEAEQDDEVSEDELRDVEWAGLGIVGFDLIQMLLLGLRVTIALPEFLERVGAGAKQLCQELPGRVAAAQAGYDEVVASVLGEDQAADNVFVVLEE